MTRFLPVLAFVLSSTLSQSAQSAPAGPASPAKLRTDDLATPLGLDNPAPRLAWQLRDGRPGALQTAYRVEVATSVAALDSGKPDAWDSGRVASGQSVGVVYGGAALKPSTRYYWRVLAWDKDGKPYPASEPSWWETGLLSPDAWSDAWPGETGPSGAKSGAKWIGYQTWEEAAVRSSGATWVTTPDWAELAKVKAPEQHIAYTLTFPIGKPVKRSILFVTGGDVATAWVNGVKVATGAPLPPWKQLPWKKYVRVDVTPQVHPGDNLLAVEITHYNVNPNGMAGADSPPMSATLVAELEDGATVHFASTLDSGWKTSIHPQAGWNMSATGAGAAGASAADASAAAWKPVVVYTPAPAMDASLPGDPWPTQSVKALRHEFEIAKPIASARLYATALGAYQVFVNGKRAGADVLSPGWTDYRLRLKYQTYDVTSSLTHGSNAIAALIAPGWYSTPLMWFQQPNVYGKTPPSFIAQLRIAYADGSVDWVATGGNWAAEVSPTLKAEIYDGETQDARRIQPGWDQPHFKGDGWAAAEVRSPELTGVRIDGQDFQPILVERTLLPKSMTQPSPGVYLYDMGQNFSGVERLRVQGPAGTDIEVRTGEVLNPDGTLYTDNLRTAKSTDHFILAGKGIEEFEPQFTFHGFRYLELSGLPGKPLKDSVQGVVFHTAAPFDAQLKTGSKLIDSLWRNILWGQRSNFVGVPTDCPQRDERLGWTADAQVFWRAASFNMDLAAFSRKYSADLRGTQIGSGKGTGAAGTLYGIFAPGIAETDASSGAGWSDAGVIIPWTSWMQTGDTQVLEQNWDAMTKYLAAIERGNPDHLWVNNAGIPFGDWLSPEGPTKFPLVATALWGYDTTLMAQMAHALGKTAEEAAYTQLFTQIQAAFTKAFVRDDGFISGADLAPSPFGAINNPDAKAKDGDTQTGYVLALNMHLVPDSLRAAVADRLVAKIEANHGLLGTGFLGTPYLLAVLTESGHRDLAYKLLLNTDYPSWGYLVGHGATTMWERWNGDQMRGDPSMNSYNHYAYGAVADWIYRYAAGVDATASNAGFHTVYLHPAFDTQLGSIDFTYASPYGDIHSAWTIAGGAAHWALTIPPNATGWLPVSEAEAAHWKLDGVPLGESKTAAAATEGGQKGYTLPAGSFRFEVSDVR